MHELYNIAVSPSPIVQRQPAGEMTLFFDM